LPVEKVLQCRTGHLKANDGKFTSHKWVETVDARLTRPAAIEARNASSGKNIKIGRARHVIISLSPHPAERVEVIELDNKEAADVARDANSGRIRNAEKIVVTIEPNRRFAVKRIVDKLRLEVWIRLCSVIQVA